MRISKVLVKIPWISIIEKKSCLLTKDLSFVLSFKMYYLVLFLYYLVFFIENEKKQQLNYTTLSTYKIFQQNLFIYLMLIIIIFCSSKYMEWHVSIKHKQNTLINLRNKLLYLVIYLCIKNLAII